GQSVDINSLVILGCPLSFSIKGCGGGLTASLYYQTELPYHSRLRIIPGLDSRSNSFYNLNIFQQPYALRQNWRNIRRGQRLMKSSDVYSIFPCAG
ncbi:MAG: hypothetical protein ACYSR9_03040, partial [Planctomycetota bacterium]